MLPHSNLIRLWGPSLCPADQQVQAWQTSSGTGLGSFCVPVGIPPARVLPCPSQAATWRRWDQILEEIILSNVWGCLSLQTAISDSDSNWLLCLSPLLSALCPCPAAGTFLLGTDQRGSRSCSAAGHLSRCLRLPLRAFFWSTSLSWANWHKVFAQAQGLRRKSLRIDFFQLINHYSMRFKKNLIHWGFILQEKLHSCLQHQNWLWRFTRLHFLDSPPNYSSWRSTVHKINPYGCTLLPGIQSHPQFPKL